MRKFFLLFLKIKNNNAIALLFLILLFPLGAAAITAPSVTIFPDTVIQGEPMRVTVESVSSAVAVKKISFDGKAVPIFSYQGKPTAFIGIDLNKNPTDYKVVVTLTDGTKFEKTILVGDREKIKVRFDIPEKLGGNTSVAAGKLLRMLGTENRSIYSVRTIPKQLWTNDFRFPILNPLVTDPYGYSRQTVGHSLPHKGTDFRAKEGTVVLAMNRGIIRLARTYRVYGKTLIIDHGLGLFTLYMHLSKINVNEGELVKQGQVVGLSGSTGYVLSSHLHVSVWLDKVSVDPVRFLELF